MDVTTRALERLREITNKAPELTQSETKEPQLSTFHMFMSVQDTNAYCHKAQRTAGIPISSFNFDKNRIVLRHSPMDDSLQNALP